jgi:hypothetical protein
MALASRGFVVAAPPHQETRWRTSHLLVAGFFDSLPNRVPDVRLC